MKHWRDFEPNCARLTLQAFNSGYRAVFDSKQDANAAMRELQKFAAAVRRDPGASPELWAATAKAPAGVVWYRPVLDGNGAWLVLGGARPSKRSVDSLISRLP